MKACWRFLVDRQSAKKTVYQPAVVRAERQRVFFGMDILQQRSLLIILSERPSALRFGWVAVREVMLGAARSAGGRLRSPGAQARAEFVSPDMPR